jgi:hypothetical protein
MATLDFVTPDPFKQFRSNVDGWSDDFWKRESALMNELRNKANTLPEPITKGYTMEQLIKAMVGRIIRFPVADGYAIYFVTQLKPLKLRHLAFGDGYQSSAAEIRGFRWQDAVEQVLRELEWKKACDEAAKRQKKS